VGTIANPGGRSHVLSREGNRLFFSRSHGIAALAVGNPEEFPTIRGWQNNNAKNRREDRAPLHRKTEALEVVTNGIERALKVEGKTPGFPRSNTALVENGGGLGIQPAGPLEDAGAGAGVGKFQEHSACRAAPGGRSRVFEPDGDGFIQNVVAKTDGPKVQLFGRVLPGVFLVAGLPPDRPKLVVDQIPGTGGGIGVPVSGHGPELQAGL